MEKAALVMDTELNRLLAPGGTALNKPCLLICCLLVDTNSRSHLGRDIVTVSSCPWAGLIHVYIALRSAAGVWSCPVAQS